PAREPRHAARRARALVARRHALRAHRRGVARQPARPRPRPSSLARVLPRLRRAVRLSRRPRVGCRTLSLRMIAGADRAALTVMTPQPIRGQTVRWRFTDGPTKDTEFEHEFGVDGHVTYRMIGSDKSTTEKRYVAEPIGDGVVAVAYLASSGWTLTCMLDFE